MQTPARQRHTHTLTHTRQTETQNTHTREREMETETERERDLRTREGERERDALVLYTNQLRFKERTHFTALLNLEMYYNSPADNIKTAKYTEKVCV